MIESAHDRYGGGVGEGTAACCSDVGSTEEEPASCDNLSEEEHDPALIDLLSCINGNRSARRLLMKNACLDLAAQDSLCDVLVSCCNLSSVEIRNVRCDHGKRLRVPLELFRQNRLSEILLSRCALISSASRALSAKIQPAVAANCLSKLILSDVEFLNTDDRESEGIRFFATCFASAQSLKVLSLSKLSMNDDDKVQVLEGLVQNTSPLLDTVHLEGMGLKEGHAPWLARFLANKQSHLQELSLRKNDLTARAVEIVLSKGLGAIRRLNVSENPIGDSGAATLVRCLKDSASIQELRLVDCEIWQSGCIDLAAAIPSLPTLTRLSLDGNDFDECFDRIVDAVKMNFRLVHLLDTLPHLLKLERRKQRLARGKTTHKGGLYEVLDFHLRMNHAGRRFLVEPVLPSLLPKVFTHRGACTDTSVLYHFLKRSAPLLCGGPHVSFKLA